MSNDRMYEACQTVNLWWQDDYYESSIDKSDRVCGLGGTSKTALESLPRAIDDYCSANAHDYNARLVRCWTSGEPQVKQRISLFDSLRRILDQAF